MILIAKGGLLIKRNYLVGTILLLTLMFILIYFSSFMNLTENNNIKLEDNKSVEKQNDQEDLERLIDKNSQIMTWGHELVGTDTEIVEEKVNIAILDSGINKTHVDLKNKVTKEFNAIGSSSPIEDKLGHGTAVAGIITANNNDEGIVGITQNANIYSVKVIQDDGKINKQDFIDGLEWAISNDVDIINLSLGFKSDFPELKSLISSAINKGIVIIAASGNSQGLNAQFPARYEGVISVGVINQQKKPTNISAIGKIDFVAPGHNILSLNKDGYYSDFNGSSFSTAFVTGVVAEYLSKNVISKDKNTQSNVFYYLQSTSLKLEGTKESVGYGIPIIKNY